MIRKTHFFLVAIDEDPIPGAMDKDKIEDDVKHVIERSFISAYNPKAVRLGSTTRASNFTQDTKVELDIDISEFGTDNIIFQSTLDIEYSAERPASP